jgi:hypothetical protein
MPRESEQIVINIQVVDINRFDPGCPGRYGAKVSYSEITERIAFQTKIDFQILSGSVPKYDLPFDCQQNGTMKNDQERHARSEADQHTMPNPTGVPHLFLIVFGHHSDCIAALLESKCPVSANPRVRHCVRRPVA